MDQNRTDQNQQNPAMPTPSASTQMPVTEQPMNHEPITTVQQPTDAQPISLPVEPQPQASETTLSASPVMGTASPIMPASESPMQPQVTTAMPTGGNQQNNKPLMMIIGVFIIVMLAVGGIVFVMGQMNQTKRLGMETEKSLPANIQNAQTPTATPSPLPEEQELNAIDTGDPESELQNLNVDVNSLQ